MKKNFFVVIASILLCFTTSAQKIKVYPTNWFVGMKNQNLQLLIYGKNIANQPVKLQKYKGVKLLKVSKVENTNYLFVDLEISNSTEPGAFSVFVGNEKYDYSLNKRTSKPMEVNQSDFIYLLMPDRFSDGDKSNNKFADMIDSTSDRNNPWKRHGGDLKGVENHLDYLKELGVTALWMTPVLENNQPLTNEGGNMRSAYHGYGFTDQYQVDKRFGGNEAYKKMIDAAHSKGLKVIQDAVYNHVGINHWFLKDMPSKDWLNNWDKYTNTSYKDQPIIDPYASKIDKKTTINGWFVPFLPDLNHKNPYLANYLIQHALWTVENFGIDAWRIDTYIYNDMEFMNRCNKALLDEHPKMLIFGESWVRSALNQSYFTQNKVNFDFKCNLPSTCDFITQAAIISSLKEDYGWDEGVQKLYQTLAQDVVYEHPEKLVTFLDNHDIDRYYSLIGEDYDKFKMGLTWLLTIRGIPQMYYGTEILMKNFKNPTDAEVRKDFPGGFDGDLENKFFASGRNKIENETFDFVKKLANYRKKSDAITKGKFLQYTPVDGIYIYFRKSENQTVMVISNTNKTEKIIELEKYSEGIGAAKTAQNVMNNTTINDLKAIKISAKTALVLELK
jgi:neopullulanase